MSNPSASLPGVRVQKNILWVSRSDAWVWGIALSGILVGAVLAPFGLRVYPGAIVVLSLGPLFFRLDRKTMPDMLFGPAIFMYLYHALGYAIGAIGQIFVSGLLQINVTEFEEGLIQAQWGSVLGLITFAIVYQLVFIRINGSCLSRKLTIGCNEEKAWAGYAVIMLVVATMIIVFGFISGASNRLARVEDVSTGMKTIYSAFQVVHQAMFFFLAFAAARLRKGWIVLWILAFSVYSMFFILDGGRGTVVTAGLLSAMGWAAGGVPMRKILGVVFALSICFIPLSGIVNIYRNSFSVPPETISERWAGFTQSAHEFSIETFSGEANPAGVFLERITTFTVDRVFVKTPDEIPFAGWEGIENVPYAFVPRVVLPDRPDLTDGNELAIRYGAALPETTGSYMPAVGDGYRRFGWLGIPVLYTFLALMFASISAVAYRYRSRREWMALLVFLTITASEIMITTLLTGFYILLWSIPKYLVFFWFLSWLQDRLTLVQVGSQ